MKTTPILLFLLTLTVFAVEPNNVKTKVYKVGKDGTGTETNLVSTTYSDGLGRQIQSKVKIDDTHDRTACTFYDDAGRPDSSTKAFIDQSTNAGSYLPGDLGTLNATGGPLRDRYPADLCPFSYSKYSDDPLSRVIEQNGPGARYATNASKSWYMGVSDEITRTINFTYVSTPYSVTFENGFITTTLTDQLLTAICNRLLNNDDFNCTGCPGAKYSLTITKDSRGNYTQDIKDLFGKTVATRAKASTSNEIISKYSYDILGNLKTEEAPKPSGATINNTEYTYNTLGQLVRKVTPDGGAFGYAYTKTGQLACDTSIASDGSSLRLRKYTYDLLDRQIKTEIYKNSSWIPVQFNYYDRITNMSDNEIKTYNIPVNVLSSLKNINGRIFASVGVNRVSNFTYYVTDIFSYDEEGKIDRKNKVVPGLPLQSTTFYYDIQGKVTRDIVECGTQTITRNYAYDKEGRQKSISQDDVELVNYTYDELSRMDYKDLGTTSVHRVDYDYDIRDWITTIASPGNSINRFSEYLTNYEANGNIATAEYAYNYSGATSPLQFDLTYSYDGVNRLTDVATSNTDYEAHYGHDVIGRFTSKKEGLKDHPDYEYYTGNNRLRKTASNNDNQYYYDKHGNLVVDRNKYMVIEYDWRDMPIVFRFYDYLQSTITCETNGQVKVNDTETDLYKYLALKSGGQTPIMLLLSQVVMLYDASGNRVMKMEGK
jgi:YD repeat-containing protein